MCCSNVSLCFQTAQHDPFVCEQEFIGADVTSADQRSSLSCHPGYPANSHCHYSSPQVCNFFCKPVVFSGFMFYSLPVIGSAGFIR